VEASKCKKPIKILRNTVKNNEETSRKPLQKFRALGVIHYYSYYKLFVWSLASELVIQIKKIFSQSVQIP
jgi:hypothetical protein